MTLKKSRATAIKARDAAENRAKDVAFLSDPDKWPHWPYCPVKRYVEHDMICGVVPDGQTYVLEGLYVWGFISPEQVKAAKKHNYASYEAMCADGWMVD